MPLPTLRARYMIVLLVLLLLPLRILAARAEGMAGPQVSPADVVAVLFEDFNGDGLLDKAVLYHNGDADFVDLSLYLARKYMGEYPAETAHIATVAWDGHGYGNMPYLTVNDLGSLQVIDGNESVGRGRWAEILTIAWRDGQFVVAGFTFDSYDTLDLQAGGTCDANFLSGRGVYTPNDGTPVIRFSVPSGGVPLDMWSAEMTPARCAAG